MALELSAARHRELKREAHHLDVIVTAGAAGLSDAVLAEMDRALADHELVKVKLAAADRGERRSMVDTACERLEAACVQAIGHTATLYRPNPDRGTG